MGTQKEFRKGKESWQVKENHDWQSMEEHPYTKPLGRTAPFITAPNCAPSSVSWPDRVCPWHVASGVSLRLDMPDERLRQLLATTRVLRDDDGQDRAWFLFCTM